MGGDSWRPCGGLGIAGPGPGGEGPTGTSRASCPPIWRDSEESCGDSWESRRYRQFILVPSAFLSPPAVFPRWQPSLAA
jgi:hypothetical protein